MIEAILANPETLRGWVEVVVLLLAVIAAWRTTTEENRWAKIRALIPDAHRLAERVAALTTTRKDDEFLRQLRSLLGSLGIELRPHEVEAVRAMGSAEHQTWKLAAEVVPTPTPAPGSTSPAPGASSPNSTGAVLPGSP